MCGPNAPEEVIVKVLLSEDSDLFIEDEGILYEVKVIKRRPPKMKCFALLSIPLDYNGIEEVSM